MYDIQTSYAAEKHPSEYSLQDIIDQIEITPEEAQKEHGELLLNIDGYIIHFKYSMNEDAGFDLSELTCKYGKYDAFSDLSDLDEAISEKLYLAWHTQKVDLFELLAKKFKPTI